MARRYCSASTACLTSTGCIGRHDDEVHLYAFDCLALDGDDLRKLPLSMRKTNLARLLARRPDGIFVAPFEQGEIGPDLFRQACEFGLEGLVSKRSAAVGPALGVRVRKQPETAPSPC
jgi:ATP dependent DNA ligase domain